MAPFLPFSSQRVWSSLGHDTDVHTTPWSEATEDIPDGQRLRVGKPPFAKIELADAAAGPADRLDVRVARIIDVKDHPNADKLYVLQVDLGDERRQIVAGIRENYAAAELLGRRIALLANLEPAKLRGVASNGMLLAGEDEKDVGLVLVPDDADVGAQVLGVRGAPTLPFSEFKKYKLQVGEGGTVVFLGLNGEVRVPLRTGTSDLKVDKGLKVGTWIH
jgi:methionyl-tRNA synthetase